MKILILIFCILLSPLYLYNRDIIDIENPSVLIYLHTEGKKLSDVGVNLVNSISEKLKNRLPCVRITTIVDLIKMIQEDRAKSISDENYVGNMNDISKALNSPIYILHFNVIDLGFAYSINGKFSFNSCKDWIKLDPIAENFSYDSDINQMTNKFTDEIARELLAIGICPFKGEITIENTLSLNDIKEIQYNEECGFSKTEKTTDNGSKWTFKKLGRNLYLTTLEDKVWIEEWWYGKNICSKCSQIDEHGTVIGTLPGKFTTIMSQLKQESGTNNLKADSSVITFKFLDNNTFMINVVADFPKSEINDIREEKEETQCPRKTKDLNNYKKIYLKNNSINKSFGPFKGNIFDKELKLPLRKETFKYLNDKEVITTSIEFNFTR